MCRLKLRNEFNVNFLAGPSFKRLKKDDWSPVVLSPGKVVNLMETIVDEVHSVIDTPKTITRILMNSCKWDKQKLMEDFFSESQGTLYTNAKLPKNNTKTVNEIITKKLVGEECKICYLEPESVSFHNLLLLLSMNDFHSVVISAVLQELIAMLNSLKYFRSVQFSAI